MTFPTTRTASSQRNPTQGGCWGKLTSCMGYCEKKARPGKLTCWWHQFAEGSAQRLKEKLEQLRED